MRKLPILVLVAVVPFLASPQGVVRTHRPAPSVIFARTINAGLTTAVYAGREIAASEPPVQVTRVNVRVGTGATGAGTVVFRVTDGAQNCDCTANCLTTPPRLDQSATPVAISCTGACLFAPASLLSLSVTSSCASTQPSISNVEVVGYWR